MATATLARLIGSTIAKAAQNKAPIGGWYGPHMAAASRAIAERIPLVDLVLEIRDARVLQYYMLINFYTYIHMYSFLTLLGNGVEYFWSFYYALHLFDEMPQWHVVTFLSFLFFLFVLREVSCFEIWVLEMLVYMP